MAETTNYVEIIGVVGQDPIFREIGPSSCVHSFSLWTEREWKDKTTNAWKRDVDWIDVVTWNNRWLSQAIRREDWVRVTGRLQRKFYKCECGVQHYTYELLAREIKNLSRAVSTEGKGVVDEFYRNPFNINNGRGES